MRCGNSRCPQPREFMRELSFFVSEELFVAKEFYTYQQQLDKLEKEKDLLIQDRVYAENKLKEISYYSLNTFFMWNDRLNHCSLIIFVKNTVIIKFSI